MRATVSQLEKYSTAVHGFQQKYSNYIPGDIPDPYATQFGFQTRGQYSGEGDGNGILEGMFTNSPSFDCGGFMDGETAMFWVDLSTAGMIDGGFKTATPTTTNPSLPASALANFLPQAKIGGNYIYVWGDKCNTSTFGSGAMPNTNNNYFTISGISGTDAHSHIDGSLGLTPQQAYAIDKKIDDGFPQSGKVTAQYFFNSGGTSDSLYWAGTSNSSFTPYTTATPQSLTSCFDNGGGSGAQQYSLGASANGGNNLNCAISIRWQ